MKKISAIFLILIFSFQALPLEKVGQLLVSGTVTEEVQHSGGVVKKNIVEEDKTFNHHLLLLKTVADGNNTSYVAFHERLNQHPLIEKLLRPPRLG